MVLKDTINIKESQRMANFYYSAHNQAGEVWTSVYGETPVPQDRKILEAAYPWISMHVTPESL